MSMTDSATISTIPTEITSSNPLMIRKNTPTFDQDEPLSDDLMDNTSTDSLLLNLANANANAVINEELTIPILATPTIPHTHSTATAASSNSTNIHYKTTKWSTQSAAHSVSHASDTNIASISSVSKRAKPHLHKLAFMDTSTGGSAAALYHPQHVHHKNNHNDNSNSNSNQSPSRPRYHTYNRSAVPAAASSRSHQSLHGRLAHARKSVPAVPASILTAAMSSKTSTSSPRNINKGQQQQQQSSQHRVRSHTNQSHYRYHHGGYGGHGHPRAQSVRNVTPHAQTPQSGSSAYSPFTAFKFISKTHDDEKEDEKMDSFNSYSSSLHEMTQRDYERNAAARSRRAGSGAAAASSNSQRRKRANTWAACDGNSNYELIHKFVIKRFGDSPNSVPSNIEAMKSDDRYCKLSHTELLKRGRIMYDRANSLLNGNQEQKKQSIQKFEECLSIIYLLYCSYSLFLSESQKSIIITHHMNILLSLGELYVLFGDQSSLGVALKMYEEAQVLFELDANGFKRSTKINLKSYILRGMADVYIKQEEYVSALALLEEALSSAVSSNDKHTQYQILITQGRALLDAKQYEKSAVVFEKAIHLLSELRTLDNKAHDSYDLDLFRNAALCAAKIAHSHCSVVYIASTKTYAVKNSVKSMQYWEKSASLYKQCQSICKTLYGQKSLQYIQALYELSDVLCTKGDYNQSYHLYQNIQLLFKQIDQGQTQQAQEHQEMMKKTKQMIQTLRPYVNDNTTL